MENDTNITPIDFEVLTTQILADDQARQAAAQQAAEEQAAAPLPRNEELEARLRKLGVEPGEIYGANWSPRPGWEFNLSQFGRVGVRLFCTGPDYEERKDDPRFYNLHKVEDLNTAILAETAYRAMAEKEHAINEQLHPGKRPGPFVFQFLQAAWHIMMIDPLDLRLYMSVATDASTEPMLMSLSVDELANLVRMLNVVRQRPDDGVTDRRSQLHLGGNAYIAFAESERWDAWMGSGVAISIGSGEKRLAHFMEAGEAADLAAQFQVYTDYMQRLKKWTDARAALRAEQ